MSHLLIAILLMQQKPVDTFGIGSNVQIYQVPKYAEAKEETDKGTYRWIFEDPNNEYRCYITAQTNGARYENGTFTVVCARPHKVKEKQ